MCINPASSHKHVLACNHLGARADNQLWINPIHGIRIASLANFDDMPVFNANIALDNAPMINDQCIGDHQIERTIDSLTRSTTVLTHTITDHFTTTEGN